MDGKPCAGAILGLLLLAGSASAGPPMITDDPGTPAKGVWEENLALIVSDTRRQTVWATPSFDTNYNVTDHLQLNYTLPLEIVDNAGRGPVGGVGASSLGFKYRFLDQAAGDAAGVSMSIAPSFTFNNPTHSVRRGLVVNGSNLFLPVQVGHTFGTIDVFAEAGYLLIQYQSDAWEYGVATAYHATDKLDLLAEVHCVSDTSFHFNDVIVNFGLTYAMTEKTNLLLSAGRSLRDTDLSERVVLYAGVQFHF
jgi:hypothetical protein